MLFYSTCKFINLTNKRNFARIVVASNSLYEVNEMKKVGPALINIVLGILAISVIFANKEGYFIKSTRVSRVTESNILETKKEKKEIAEKENEEKDGQELVEEVLLTPSPNPIIYEGLTMDELSAKLDRSLHSTLSGYGSVFAKESLALGLDPYLSLAIVLHETGCKWNCSTLLKQCNNVGGMKGSPSCNGGSYKSFPTLEEGIRSYLNNLYYNYYQAGLTTPELIGPKYAESPSWVSNVNSYINEIRLS